MMTEPSERNLERAASLWNMCSADRQRAIAIAMDELEREAERRGVRHISVFIPGRQP